MTRAPAGSIRVYLDANVLVRGMERTDTGAGEVGRLIEFAGRNRLELVTSELTLSEVLVGPIRVGDDHLVAAYLDLLTDDSVCKLLPVTRDILIESSQIRARSSARLADSVHVATAKLSGCRLIVSYDRRLRDFCDLDVIEPSHALFATLDAQSR
ncbi:MAG: type II toxin-antitoxin system VapC family toxin [Hyphomicrobiales bacterium]|nr:type II toxin-antitoxin system VapC family toxin [Hyphomicrobiales bacterium]